MGKSPRVSIIIAAREGQADIPALDSISYEADAGAYDIDASMAFISACEDHSETINTECGGTYRFLVYPE